MYLFDDIFYPMILLEGKLQMLSKILTVMKSYKSDQKQNSDKITVRRFFDWKKIVIDYRNQPIWKSWINIIKNYHCYENGWLWCTRITFIKPYQL